MDGLHANPGYKFSIQREDQGDNALWAILQYLNAIENESYTALVLVSWIQFATSASGLDDACRS